MFFNDYITVTPYERWDVTIQRQLDSFMLTAENTSILCITGPLKGNPLVNSPHKGLVMRKALPYLDIIMAYYIGSQYTGDYHWPRSSIGSVGIGFVVHLEHSITFPLPVIKLVKLHHDDVIKWKHFSRYWPFVRGIHLSPVNSPQKGQWRGALMFSLIFAWTNDWVNNRGAGDLRRHRAHYDVIVMILEVGSFCIELIFSLNKLVLRHRACLRNYKTTPMGADMFMAMLF